MIKGYLKMDWNFQVAFYDGWETVGFAYSSPNNCSRASRKTLLPPSLCSGQKKAKRRIIQLKIPNGNLAGADGLRLRDLEDARAHQRVALLAGAVAADLVLTVDVEHRLLRLGNAIVLRVVLGAKRVSFLRVKDQVEVALQQSVDVAVLLVQDDGDLRIELLPGDQVVIGLEDAALNDVEVVEELAAVHDDLPLALHAQRVVDILMVRRLHKIGVAVGHARLRLLLLVL